MSVPSFTKYGDKYPKVIIRFNKIWERTCLLWKLHTNVYYHFLNSTAFFLAQSIIIWTMTAVFQLVFLSTGSCLTVFEQHTPHSHQIHLQRHHFHCAILSTRNPQWPLKSLPTTCKIKSKFPYWQRTNTTWLQPNIQSFLPLLFK